MAAAVLLRALEPTAGIALMRSRRGERIADRDLARGPGRLCAALALTLADNGLDLCGDALWLEDTPDFPPNAPIAATPRIGIAQAGGLALAICAGGQPLGFGTQSDGHA